MYPVITVSDLTKSYPLPRSKAGEKEFLAVKGTSFQVFKGEIFGILGPNGAGKTTTLEIIEGLKPQTSGTVEVLGFDNLKQTSEIKSRIGVQLQSSQYLAHLTLLELLDLFASLYPCSGPTNNSYDPEALLELVNLGEKKHELVINLSGGQKQRFTIATALVNNPEILFLDEPTTGLDPAARRNLWKLICDINSKGMTVVLTTHFMEEAEFLCHRVAIMDQGRILEIDEPQKLINRISETTQVSFFSGQKVNKEIFSKIPEITKIYAVYPKVILELSSLDNIASILGILKKNRVPFSGFTVKTATLEDVYLDLTGHDYET